MVGIGPSGSGRRDMRERLLARRLQICFPERGHQTGVDVLAKNQPTPPAYQPSAGVAGVLKPRAAEARRRRGKSGSVSRARGEGLPYTAPHAGEALNFA